MKPKRHVVIPRVHLQHGYPKSTRQVKPLRYYIAGGADVDGDALKQDKSSMSEPDNDSENWTQVFGNDANGEPLVYADPFCDPRHDIFSIGAMASAPDFKSAVSKAMEQQQSGDVVPATPAAPASEPNS